MGSVIFAFDPLTEKFQIFASKNKNGSFGALLHDFEPIMQDLQDILSQ